MWTGEGYRHIYKDTNTDQGLGILVSIGLLSFRNDSGGWGGKNQEFGIHIHTLLYTKQITNKDPL